jgi:hypothetical protein
MRVIVLEDYWPITRSCGLIAADIQKTSEAVVRILEDRDLKLLPLTGLGELQGPTTHEIDFIDGDLSHALQALDPLSVNIVTRHILLQTKAKWTSYFNNSNLLDGDRQLIGALSAELRTKTIYVKNQENTKDQFGAFVFHYYVNGTPARIVANTIQDRGWDFEQGGTPFPFENLEQYSASKKANRFDAEKLVRYLRDLDLRPFDDDFYVVDAQHLAYLIKRIDRDERLKSRIQELSLFQARFGG